MTLVLGLTVDEADQKFMTTKTVELNSTEYKKLDTTAGSAIDVQNVSSEVVLVILSESQPAADDTNYYALGAWQGLARDGKTGDMWAKVVGGNPVGVTVGE